MYSSKDGTSWATAHVAGVAALLMSHFPNCTNNQIRNAMLASTSEPPAFDSERTRFGWDKRYGWGIVNAGRAYELLNTTGCVCAGGAFNSTTYLSEQALGGKDQKVIEPCNVSPATKLSCNSLDIHSTYFSRNIRIWQGFQGR